MHLLSAIIYCSTIPQIHIFLIHSYCTVLHHFNYSLLPFTQYISHIIPISKTPIHYKIQIKSKRASILMMMDGHMHDMGGMSPSTNGTMAMPHKMKHFMHMTFFWGKNSEILFDQWPGDKTGMYILALVVVFVMSFLVELLSSTRFVKPGSNHFAAGLVQTVLHLLRVGISYLVMLALMSFNGGVFLVAVIGHALGFFIFRSNAFKKTDYNKGFDLPPMNTC